MKELTITGSQTSRMSSLEIAKLMGKQHKNVLRDINLLIEQDAIDRLKSEPISYIDDMNRKQSMYLLDFESTMTLITGYDAKRRSLIIRRWQELEAQTNTIRLPDFTDPIIAARAWADEVEQKQILQTKIEEQAPKVEFATQVEQSINAIPLGQFAKVLTKHGLNIGQNRLFAFLRDMNILMDDNTPYQAQLNQGWFELKQSVGVTAKGIFTRLQTLVTGKGQIAITRLVMASYKSTHPKATYLPGLEVRA